MVLFELFVPYQKHPLDGLTPSDMQSVLIFQGLDPVKSSGMHRRHIIDTLNTLVPDLRDKKVHKHGFPSHPVRIG